MRSGPAWHGLGALFLIGALLGDGTPAAVAGDQERASSDLFSLRFDSERIELVVAADSVEVHSRYVLVARESTMRPTTLFYPFPVDSLLGGARLVSLTVAAGARPPATARREVVPHLHGVRFWLEPGDADTLMVDAVYRQALRADYARYVVTTTRAWGRPLRHASFLIHLPAGATPLEFSFPFTRQDEAGEPVYTYEANDFYPDHDITVRWVR